MQRYKKAIKADIYRRQNAIFYVKSMKIPYRQFVKKHYLCTKTPISCFRHNISLPRLIAGLKK